MRIPPKHRFSVSLIFLCLSLAVARADELSDRTEQLKSKDDLIRASALTFFVNAGSAAAKSVLPQIVEALRDPAPNVRGRAAEAIGVVGPDAQEAGAVLIHLILEDKDSGVQTRAANALQFLGPPGHNPAIEQLGLQVMSPDRKVQLKAARALGRIGVGAKQAAPSLIQALKDEDVEVRRFAAMALASMQAAPPEAVPILIGALGTDNDSEMASLALFQIGDPALPSLIEALSSKSGHVKKGAALALLRMGPRASSASPMLIRAMKDPDPEVRKAAARALTAMGLALPEMNEPRVEYPCWWTYAIVGTDEEDLLLVAGEIAKGTEHRVKFSKLSAAKRYASLHVEIYVANQEERDRFFEAFKSHPRVKFVI